MWRALPPPFTLPTRSLGALTPVGLTPQRGKLEAQGWGELGPSWGCSLSPVPELVCDLAAAGVAAPARRGGSGGMGERGCSEGPAGLGCWEGGGSPHLAHDWSDSDDHPQL